MLSFASDFWPLFWTIIGTGALLTVLMCTAAATFQPAWFQRHPSATVHHLPTAGDAPAAASRKAA
jgi:hypothetical protein